MKILFVTNMSPGFPNCGAVIQTHHFIRKLSEKHEVGLWSFSTEDADRDLGALSDKLSYVHFEKRQLSLNLFERVQRRLGWMLGKNPMMRWGYTREAMMASLDSAISEFQPDVVQFEQLHVAYPLMELSKRKKRPLLVFNAHDAIHVVLERSLKEEIKERPLLGIRGLLDYHFCKMMKRMELAVVKAADVLFTVSEVDAEALYAEKLAKSYHVLANGVDTDFFEPLDWKKLSEEPTLIFVGNLSYGPNSEAIDYYVENLHRPLREKYPKMKLIVVGGVPPALEKYTGIEGIEFVGFQSEFRDLFAKSHMSLVPLLSGSGTRFKILDSWAMGRPVVSTTIGAEGLWYENGDNILIGDDVKSLVDAVDQVMVDVSLREKLAKRGRETVEKGYSWNSIVDKLEGYLRDRLKEKE